MATKPPGLGQASAYRVADAISGAHFSLVALMEHIHGESTSSGRRAILLNLKTLGPKTVPQLAAMRPVSRQYIQRLVDDLAAEGLVGRQANARHKRSPLIALTKAGDKVLAAMLARERPFVEGLASAGNPETAEIVVLALETLRDQVLKSLARASGASPGKGQEGVASRD